MKSVIKQEWKMRSRSILWASGVLLLLNVIMYICNGVVMVNPTSKTRFMADMFMSIAMTVDTFGVLIYTLCAGAGNMRSMLFSDTGYLMMSLPKNSFVLIAGKMLTGLFEFLIYCVHFCVYVLILLAQTSGTSFTDVETSESGVIISNAIAGNGFWGRLGTILKDVFTEHLPECLNFVGMVIVCFVLLEIVYNCAITVYTSFCKNRRFTKLLLLVILFLMIWLAGKVTSNVIGAANFDIFDNFTRLWLPIGIFSVFGAVYYVITCLLYEKKVSL